MRPSIYKSDSPDSSSQIYSGPFLLSSSTVTQFSPSRQAKIEGASTGVVRCRAGRSTGMSESTRAPACYRWIPEHPPMGTLLRSLKVMTALLLAGLPSLFSIWLPKKAALCCFIQGLVQCEAALLPPLLRTALELAYRHFSFMLIFVLHTIKTVSSRPQLERTAQ